VKAAAVSFATVLCVEALVFAEMTSGRAHSRPPFFRLQVRSSS
jgi:hypothetical protein